MQSPHRLRRRQDFDRARQRGRSTRSTLLILNAVRTADDVTRCGFNVSRRVGKAVVRNRVRRRLREIMRQALPALDGGWDLVLVARPGAAQATFQTLRAAVDELLGRARVATAERAGAS